MHKSSLSNNKPRWVIVALLGLLITLFSLYGAIQTLFTAWYTPFVIGSYCLFGAITKGLYGSSTLSLLINKPLIWLKLYFYIAIFGFVTEVLGRNVGNFWYYPKFDFGDLVIHVWLIGYPLALFSAIESYWCILYIVKFIIKSSKPTTTIFIPLKVSYIIIFFTLILIASSLIFYFLELSRFTTLALFALLISLSFFFDSIANIIKKPTVIYVGSNPFIPGLLISVPLIGLLHEIPNTFVWEWVYQNVPFISLELFKVNVLVLTLGWFYLVFIPLSICHLAVAEAYLPITPPKSDLKV